MAKRAADAGHPISHVQLGGYANGSIRAFPSEATRKAIAAALFGRADGASLEEVTAAARQTAAPSVHVTVSPHALAFLRLTEDRTEEEIRQTLGAVEAVLRAMDASRQAALQELEADQQDTPGAVG